MFHFCMCLAFLYALCHCFSMFLGRHLFPSLRRSYPLLRRSYPIRSPLTTISSGVDKGMVAFWGGASDMSFKNFTLDRALASGCLLKNI